MLSPLPAHSHKHPNTHHHAIILSGGKWCAYALARSARRSNATVVGWTRMVVALVCARFYYCCANNDRRHQIEVEKYAARKCAARMLAIACVQNITAMAMTAEYCTRMRKVLAGCVCVFFFWCVQCKPVLFVVGCIQIFQLCTMRVLFTPVHVDVDVGGV